VLRNASVVATLAVFLMLPALASGEPVQPVQPVHKKRPAGPHWHGYGDLPGYPPIHLDNRSQGYWYGGPQFYRGRWNGGGFGPCWTKTPIGPVWNCG